MAYGLANALHEAGLDGDLARNLEAIRTSKKTIVTEVLTVVRSLDTANKDSWKSIVLGAAECGISDEDLHRELGASLSTIHRWKKDDIAPREGTRRLMKKAIVELIEQKLAG